MTPQRKLLLTLAALLIFAWFVIGERSRVREKFLWILLLVAIFAAYRWLSGVPPQYIFEPIFGPPPDYF